MLKVYFADLRHDYQGVLSAEAMPLGIGYMKAVMDAELKDVESSVFAYPNDLERALIESIPNVLFLTNYMWNEKLSFYYARRVKEMNPSTLIVVGGPNIHIEDHRKIGYFEKIPFVDIYAIGEGDFYASFIVKSFIEDKLDISKLLKRNIHSSVYRQNGQNVIVSSVEPRSRNLDEISSPWLTGIMDKFFDGKLTPLFETNRGCPFTCAFCVQGTKWYHRVNHFSLERIREEIFYIARKVKEVCPEQKVLKLADPNFGMYDRDIEISSYFGETQRDYNWPLFIDATTGKNRAKNIIKSIEKVNGALVMYQAVQSLDEDVLENIKRKNIRLDTYEDVQVYIRGRGLKSNSDLILGLPGESLKSHLNSMAQLINSGTHKLNNFQSMMLKGSEMETLAFRSKFTLTSKFRLLPKSFGIYNDQLVFESDEIVVNTETLTNEDYITARKYHFVVSLFWNESKFESLVRFLNSLGFSNWDFLEHIFDFIEGKNDKQFDDLFQQFLAETKSELFNTEEEMVNFYTKENNFNKLVKSELGDNLVYKYRAMGSFWYWDVVCKIAFEVALKMILTLNQRVFLTSEFQNFLEEWRDFTTFKFSFGTNVEELNGTYTRILEFNIPKWLNILDAEEWMSTKFQHPQIFYFNPKQENQTLFDAALKIWGYTLPSLPMLVRRIQAHWTERSFTLSLREEPLEK